MYEEQDSSPLAVMNGDAETHIEQAAVEPNAVVLMERVMIDTQIATAKQFPRSLSKFLQRAQEMATVDEETAKSCIYERPVGKEKNGTIKYAKGESIREAEIVAACYGNLRVQGMIVEVGLRQVKAVGVCHDLESNYAAKAEAVESVITASGQPYSERMRLVVAKAAQSKAIRDAVFRVVPKSLCKSITQAAREIALGKGLTLQQRRERALDWIVSLDIDPDRVWRALGVGGVEDLGNDQLLILTGLRTAIKDGDVSVAEAFPEQTESEPAPATNGNAAVKAKLGQQQKPSTEGRKKQTKTTPSEPPQDAPPKPAPESPESSTPKAETPSDAADETHAVVDFEEGRIVKPNIHVGPDRDPGYGVMACSHCKRTFNEVRQVGERHYCRYCGTGKPIITDHYEGDDLLTLAESESDPESDQSQETPAEPPSQKWRCRKGHVFEDSERRPNSKTEHGLCPKCLSQDIEPI